MSIENEVLCLVQTAVTNTINDGLQKYLLNNLFGYHSPFEPLIKDAVSKVESLPVVLKEAIDETMREPEFKEQLKVALRKRLVNDLVKSFSLEGAMKNTEVRQQIFTLLENLVKP